MASLQLLTISDIRKYRQLSANFNVDRLNAYITDLSENFLRPHLGKVLHAEFIAGIAQATPAQKWVDLLNGVSYVNSENETVLFYGVKPFLVFHFLAIFTREADSHLTEVGTVNISGENYRIASDKREMEANFKNRAMVYGNEINDFLEAKKADYTSSISKPNNNMTDLTFTII
jgi:hypothetical protein